MDLLAFGRDAVEVNNESGPKFIRESMRRRNQNANSSADFVDPRSAPVRVQRHNMSINYAPNDAQRHSDRRVLAES